MVSERRVGTAAEQELVRVRIRARARALGLGLELGLRLELWLGWGCVPDSLEEGVLQRLGGCEAQVGVVTEQLVGQVDGPAGGAWLG